jgi:hypothetical protein
MIGQIAPMIAYGVIVLVAVAICVAAAITIGGYERKARDLRRRQAGRGR